MNENLGSANDNHDTFVDDDDNKLIGRLSGRGTSPPYQAPTGSVRRWVGQVKIAS